jgi:hypothetical protein
MKRKMIALLVSTAGLALIVAGVGPSSRAQEDEPPSIDRTRAAEDPTPVAAPPAGAEVLVVVFDLTFEEGRLQSAEVQSAEPIASFSPKVGVVEGGEWQVITEGSGSITFFTWDPGWQEAEAEAESENDFEWVPITGSVEWVLVVPLSDAQERIEVERIMIVDTRSGEVVIDTDV